MSTYLLTWNPTNHFPWDDLEDYIEEVKGGRGSVYSWSCGGRKSMFEGDRVFLMRLGDELRGIVASGMVERRDPSTDGPAALPGSDVFEDGHWEDPTKTARYINVRFDTLLGRERSLLLTRLEALNRNLPSGAKAQRTWTPQASGIRIEEEVANRLEAAWQEFVGSDEGLDRQGREYSRLIKRRGGGEGLAHLRLKKHVAMNPQSIGLPIDAKGVEEYSFVSGDECDVVFDLEEGSAVVEIKDGRERKGELVKGIYQAVKYRALMAAERGKGAHYPVSAYLVAYNVPADIAGFAAKFEIECKTLDPSSVEARV